MQTATYWNEVGSTKNFEDPLYLDKVHLDKDATIVEYGCGYGRMLNMLKEAGYHRLVGFDLAFKMIERGKQSYPELDLRLLDENAKIPLKGHSVDAVFMSTVLCCMVDLKDQLKLIEEIKRILKHEGMLYITDFLICSAPYFMDKYQKGYEEHQEWGMYTTSEHLTVRHYTSAWIMKLLEDFDIQWFEQFDFKTMNHNPARTFHCVAKLRHNGISMQ